MPDPGYTATYGNEDLDVYNAPDSPTKPLIVYVHGGAWRSENKEEHKDFAVRVRDLTGCPVAVLDYRLTKSNNEVKHPAHAKDVLDALRFLIAWPDDAPFDRTRLYLVGHSSGAHILTSIFLDAAASFTPLPADNDYLKPEDSLLQAVRGIALASGICDLGMLLDKFPDYDKRFIRAAFRDPYEFWNTTRYPLHGSAPPFRWHIIHSAGDTDIDLPQSEAVFEHLRWLYTEKGWDQDRITKDWESLTVGHYYANEPRFAEMIAEWVIKDIETY